ncbi:unnamed protein product [Clonostachys rhizophaga]|uniref:Uncharacterized protein n=1 Tax=Clonostachys rhizophaga TaxID=160324 RepID=A0A9N9VLF7_9HYPO|nr:unnamed protein product [Clonostachys rhizophaga]
MQEELGLAVRSRCTIIVRVFFSPTCMDPKAKLADLTKYAHSYKRLICLASLKIFRPNVEVTLRHFDWHGLYPSLRNYGLVSSYSRNI